MESNNNNSGALFKNEKREKDSQPLYTGSCVVNGKEMRIAAWVKTAQSGKTYMSLSFSEPQPAQPQGQPQGAPQAPASDLPF